MRHQQNSYWELGGDAGQPFSTATHSTVMINMRCASLSYEDKGKRSMMHPLLIISGPKEATNLAPFLQEDVDFFCQHCHEEWRPVVGDAWAGPFEVSPGRHATLWLLGVHGDTPMHSKFANLLGVNSYLGCGFCFLNGKYHENAVRWMGYEEPVEQQFRGNTTSMFNEHKATHEQRAVRAQLVEAKMCAPEIAGCKGHSVFATLPYFHYTNFFVIPLFHAFLYGVVRDFLDAIFSPISKEEKSSPPWWKVSPAGRKLITEREANISVTAEYGHGHQNVTKRGMWTMDQFLHFMLSWSMLLFCPGNADLGMGDPLNPRVFRMYMCLRKRIIFL
mmetsp:Transcript_4818/g.14618  ORF Transcript_4818/g.14618 Transcript_4818/m.14618 type:complete len:332 (-) Transcript_4818:1287-2282(-)